MAEKTVIGDGKTIATATGETYELLEKLGAGGMGSVWKARQPSLNRFVAIKILLDSSYSAKAVERLRREAIALGSISHEGIVKLLAVQTSVDGKPFLVLELVDGHTLAEELALNNGHLPPTAFKRIFSAVLDALEQAHQAGFIHRDLKPQNILIATNGATKVTDFGITKALEDQRFQSVTQSGKTIGTPAYMSPEQWGAGNVTPASDIYSLGCLMYETLTGSPLFTGDSAFAIAHKHSSEAPLLEGKSLNPALKQILEKCLAKNATDRFQTAQELKTQLEACDYGQRSFSVSPNKSKPTKHFSMNRGTLALAAMTVILTYAVYFGISQKSCEAPDIASSSIDSAVVEEAKKVADESLRSAFNETSAEAAKQHVNEVIEKLERKIVLADQPRSSTGPKALHELYAMKALLCAFTQPKKVAQAFERAMELDKKLGDSHMELSDCLSLANFYREQQDYPSAEKYYAKADRICNQNHGKDAISVDSLGVILERSRFELFRRNPAKATNLSERALKTCEASGIASPTLLAEAKYEVIRDLVSSGRGKEALIRGNVYARETEQDARAEGASELSNLGRYYAGINAGMIVASLTINDFSKAEKDWQHLKEQLEKTHLYPVGVMSVPALQITKTYAEKTNRERTSFWFNRTLDCAIEAKSISPEQAIKFKDDLRKCDATQDPLKWQQAIKEITDRLYQAIQAWTL